MFQAKVFLQRSKVIKNLNASFFTSENTFGRSPQRSTALMGGNYAAPPRNAALSRIPRGISGPFKKGNAVLPPRLAYQFIHGIGKSSEGAIPKASTSLETSRGVEAAADPAFVLYLHPVSDSWCIQTSDLPSVFEKTWGERGEEEGAGVGSAVAEIKLRLPFLFPRDTSESTGRWFWSAPIFSLPGWMRWKPGKVNRVDERLPRLFPPPFSRFSKKYVSLFVNGDVALGRNKNERLYRVIIKWRASGK